MYSCCGITDVGAVRHENQDAFMINKLVLSHSQLESDISAPFIVGVADGVASENNGAKASHLCLELLGNINFSSTTDINRKIMDIHTNIRTYGTEHDGSLNMQTTLCAFAVDENGEGYSINVGDSRMYLLRDGELTQITKDQTFVQMLVDSGEITIDECKSHVNRHMVLSVMGNYDDPPSPEIKKIGKMRDGDLVLLCTDGLSGTLSKDEIEEILLDGKESLARRLRTLISTAISGGSTDNITALAIICGKD